MKNKNYIFLSLFMSELAVAQPVNPADKNLQQVGLDQKLNEQVPLNLSFRDEHGQKIELAQCFNEKPVILTLVYYRCPMLCNQVLNGVTQALRALSYNPGQEFRIVTVSIDPNETPEIATVKKENYIRSYNRTGAAENWHFLTGDEPAIKELAQSVGFRYVYDPATKQFAHASGIMVLTPKGKIARYLYGIEYAPRDLQFALMEAAQERIGSRADQFILYCFQYDPASGKYTLAIMNVLRASGVMTLLILGGFIVIMLRRERKYGTGVSQVRGVSTG